MPDHVVTSSAMPSRRAVTRGTLWALPSIAVASAAPAYAASGKCWYDVVWTACGSNHTQALTAVSSGTRGTLSVSFASTFAAGRGTNMNMSVGRFGRDGNYLANSSSLAKCGQVNDTIQTLFNPGGLVLNQTGWPTDGRTGGCGTPVVPSQTVTWVITGPSGQVITPSELTVTIHDISSVCGNPTGPWADYWDSVAFSSPAVVAAQGVPGPRKPSALVGGGTGPYYRSANNDSSASNQNSWYDQFHFSGDGLPTWLKYSQHQDSSCCPTGNQFIAITGFSFLADCV